MIDKKALCDILLLEYPDKNVHGLTKKPRMYVLLLDYIKYNRIGSVEQFMIDNGFRYKQEATTAAKRVLVSKWLQSIGKNIDVARNMMTPEIYSAFCYLARIDGISISEFLKKQGYTYLTDKLASSYDYKSIRKLADEYGYKNADILKLLGLNRSQRQTISNILTNKANNSGNSWLRETLYEIDESNIIEMITAGAFHYNGDGSKYYLGNNKAGKAFFYIESESEKILVFDEFIPYEIKIEIANKHMDTLTEKEFTFKNSQPIQHIIGKPCIVINSSNNKTFKQLKYLRKNISNKRYADLFGLADFPIKFLNTDESIIKFLSEHADEYNNVTLNTPEIQPLRSYYQRVSCENPIFKNSKFSDFIDFFGFTWTPDRTRDGVNAQCRKKTDEIYKELLIRQYIMTGTSIVYFKSTDSIYERLYALARTRNMSLDAYLKSLGFSRGIIEEPTPKELLQQLSLEIEKELKKKASPHSEITRNQQLVHRLKEVYKYRCQLCDAEHYFDITLDEQKTGEKYVEVHHIIPISNIEDEEGTLDRLDNLIVVCPNHHRWLHYQNGGNFLLKTIDGVLVLTNEKSSIIIQINYHLDS